MFVCWIAISASLIGAACVARTNFEPKHVTAASEQGAHATVYRAEGNVVQ